MANGEKKERVSVRWSVENDWVAKRQANSEPEPFTASDVAKAISRDEGAVRKALRQLVERETLAELGRGRFALVGEKPGKTAGRKRGAMASRIESIEDILRRHPDGLTRQQLADTLGEDAGDVRPGRSGSTTLWKAAKDGRIVRDGRAWKAAS